MLEAMKIGVLSDTHLTRVTPALEKIVGEYFQDVDLLIHAGDMVGLSVYRFLTALPLEAVQGNMDEFPLREELPYKKTLPWGAFKSVWCTAGDRRWAWKNGSAGNSPRWTPLSTDIPISRPITGTAANYFSIPAQPPGTAAGRPVGYLNLAFATNG